MANSGNHRALFKTGNGEFEIGNENRNREGERGKGTGKGEQGIFKMGSLLKRESLQIRVSKSDSVRSFPCAVESWFDLQYCSPRIPEEIFSFV